MYVPIYTLYTCLRGRLSGERRLGVGDFFLLGGLLLRGETDLLLGGEPRSL